MSAETSFAAQIDAAISSGENLDAILRRILDHFGAQVGTVHRLDPASGTLKLAGQRGVVEALLGVIGEIPMGKGIAGAAAQARTPIRLCNLQQDDGKGVAKPRAKETGMEGAIAVPILVGGDLRGTLGIAKATRYDWSDAETQALGEVAVQVARVL
jgi:L-methionine (R)-S-oxide reductase